jgi:hypothetical protein
LEWVLLIHQLPPKPTNLRVRIWRQLQKLGAVAIKNSVYALPANDKTHEYFHWLKLENETAGGEAAVFRANSIEGTTDQEIISAFQRTRDEEFSTIAAELDGLTGAIRQQARGKHLSPNLLAKHEAELDKLHAELERIINNDFFGAPTRTAALNSYTQCEKVVRATQTPTPRPREKVRTGTLDKAKFQKQRWMTRRNIHIDRLASAWLIKQFIDKKPRFYFVRDNQRIEGAIPFDMFGAEFGHQGEDCTFETLINRFGLIDNLALVELAQIIHDIDLKDDKFHRLEAAGLNAIIDGLSLTLRDDRKLLQQSTVIFDGLLSVLGKTESKSSPKKRKRR